MVGQHSETVTQITQAKRAYVRRIEAPPSAYERALQFIKQALAGCAAGFLPLAASQYAHNEVGREPWKWWVVVAALAYSAPTVTEWAMQWCGNRRLDKIKAISFTILLESVMVTSDDIWLGYSGLALLMLINGSYAWNLAEKRDEK